MSPPIDVLEVDDLTVEFPGEHRTMRAVQSVSFTIKAGESVAIIGESGSGKTSTALAIMRLIRPPGQITSGRILVNGVDVLRLQAAQMRELRGNRIAMVVQNPMTALDPTFPVGDQIREAMLCHGTSATRDRVIELMEAVHIGSARERYGAYPHQLSGGTRQRITIAMALANEPNLIIADEPTTALDATVQAQVLGLFREIQANLGMSLLFITHNLGIAAQIAQRIIVMYAGRVVESAPSAELIDHPHHPYTVGLLNSIPTPSVSQRRLSAIQGQALDPWKPLPGCSFAPRCPHASHICWSAVPPLKQVGTVDAHQSACVLPA
jgi:peptide/nickel transport system ATP-binding protein